MSHDYRDWFRSDPETGEHQFNIDGMLLLTMEMAITEPTGRMLWFLDQAMAMAEAEGYCGKKLRRALKRNKLRKMEERQRLQALAGHVCELRYYLHDLDVLDLIDRLRNQPVIH